VRELANELGRTIELAQIGVASGRGSQAEVFASRQMLSMASDRRLELSAQAEKARAALRRWVPDAGTFELPVELPAWRDPPALSALAENLEHHPQHAMHLRALGVADADVALAREATASDRTLEFGYALRQGNNRSDMLMLQGDVRAAALSRAQAGPSARVEVATRGTRARAARRPPASIARRARCRLD
jgi:outer membrane protein TolC